MNIHEIAFCVVLAGVSSYLVSVGWYPQAVFAGFLFLIVLAITVIHSVGNFLSVPLPRINIPLASLEEKEKEQT